MITHFSMFGRYNEWANRRVYAAAAELSDAEFRADHGAFFGSVCGTLNHLLVTDRIWMHRFCGAGPSYTALDLILHDDLPTLRSERDAEDARITDFIGTLDHNRLAGAFTYCTIVNPRDVTQPLAPALAHLFNHQTHHRGQVHALLTAIAGRNAAPSLDLIAFQRETGIGLV